ncbi:MFS transporter [Hoeflea sp.]|uniref:MFS transporter n=1 Tax=Hoeflea sp. TaxID=1940281 RepID=UPI003B010D35
MHTVRRLAGAAYGTHLSDQIALVAVPLVAALTFGASPQVIGALVACQSSAHLLGSIPFGVLADRKQLRTLAIASATISFTGFLGAAASILAASVVFFGAMITLAGFGVVLFSLSALSILPRTVGPNELAGANSAIEIPRAVCSFAVPLIVGLVISDTPAIFILLAAATGAVVAASFAFSLPRFPLSEQRQTSVLPQILEGARFVVRHSLLLPIALCAVFWNFAFAALLVVLVPAIQDIYLFDPGAFGISLSAFGLAAILGNWTAGRFSAQISPWFILLFGPGSSLVAASGLLLIDSGTPEFLLYACFFLLGFGPSMWLIAQNSVRQLVTPPAMLGRVNAVIQTAIYGISPIGALIGGFVAGAAGPDAGLVLAVAAFVLSFGESLFSNLRSVSNYEDLKAV